MIYRYIRLAEIPLYRRAGWDITRFENHHGDRFALASRATE